MDRLAGDLSGGMKQKLGLACVLVHEPQLLILDEPTNGVDPVSRSEFWEILSNMKEEGMTIMVSTPISTKAKNATSWADAQSRHSGVFHSGGDAANLRLWKKQ